MRTKITVDIAEKGKTVSFSLFILLTGIYIIILLLLMEFNYDYSYRNCYNVIYHGDVLIINYYDCGNYKNKK